MDGVSTLRGSSVALVVSSLMIFAIAGGCQNQPMLGGNPFQVEQNYNVAKGADQRAADALAAANATTCPAGATYRQAAQTARDQASVALSETDAARTEFQRLYGVFGGVKELAEEFTEARQAWSDARWDYTNAINSARYHRQQVEAGSTGAAVQGRVELDNAINAIEAIRSAKSRLTAAISQLAGNYSAYSEFVNQTQDWGKGFTQSNMTAVAQAWQDSMSQISDADLQKAKDEIHSAKDKMADAKFNLLGPLHTWAQGHMSNANRAVAELWTDPDEDLGFNSYDLAKAMPELVDSGNLKVLRSEADVADAAEDVMDAAAEANRNAWLARKACGDIVDPTFIYDDPFNYHPYPDWNSTWWDISSP